MIKHNLFHYLVERRVSLRETLLLILIIILFAISQMSCSGGAGGGGLFDAIMGPGGGATTDDGAAGTGDDGDGNGAPGVDDILDDSGPGDGGEAMPPVSIPAPHGQAQATVAYACDSGSSCPVVGQSDAAQVAFVQDEAVVAYYREIKSTRLASRSSFFVPAKLALDYDRGAGIQFLSPFVRGTIGGREWQILPTFILSLSKPVILSLPAPTNVLGSKPVILSLSKDALAQDFASNVDPRLQPAGASFADASDGDQRAANGEERVAICDRPNVTCCPVVNGEFECFPVGTNETVFQYFVTDGIGVLGDVAEIKPNDRLFYLREAPEDISRSNDIRVDAVGDSQRFYTVAGGLAKRVNTRVSHEGQTRIIVEGNYRNNYGLFEASGNEVEYDTNDDKLAVLHRQEGIVGLERNNDDGFQEGRVGQQQIPDTLEYKNLKLTWDNKVRFIRKPDLNVNANQELRIYLADLNRQQEINFNEGYQDAFAYDVTSDGCGLVLYQEINNDIRFRMSCRGTEFEENYRTEILSRPLAGINPQGNFDIIIYQEEPHGEDTPITGKAVLVDKDSKKLWLVEYNMLPWWLIEDLTLISSLDVAKSIPMGVNLKDVAITQNREWLYAINEEEDKITTLKLKGENGQTLEFADIALSKTESLIHQQLSDQGALNANAVAGQPLPNNFKINPISIRYQTAGDNHYLVIGSNGLKGGLVINTSSLNRATEETLVQAKASQAAPQTEKGKPVPLSVEQCKQLFFEIDALIVKKVKSSPENAAFIQKEIDKSLGLYKEEC